LLNFFLLNFDYFWQFLAANSLRTHMDFQNFEKFQKKILNLN